jgi:hypothetical protein
MRRGVLLGTALIVHFAGAATALFASPYLVRAQEQTPKIGAPPPRSARDRLEQALLASLTKGEGARTCLTVYAPAAATPPTRPTRERVTA